MFNECTVKRETENSVLHIYICMYVCIYVYVVFGKSIILEKCPNILVFNEKFWMLVL